MKKIEKALENALSLLNNEIQNVEIEELREEYQTAIDDIQEGLKELETLKKKK